MWDQISNFRLLFRQLASLCVITLGIITVIASGGGGGGTDDNDNNTTLT
jgi:hypothetical protein